MRIGFTGTQKGMTNWQAEELKKLFILKNCSEFIFGDCVGSDVEAANIAFSCNIRIFTIRPALVATNKRAWWYNPDKDITRENGQFLLYPSGMRIRWMPAKKPLERNKDIVENCELMLATPKEFEHTLRSGTWATIRYSWKTKRDITTIPPKD